MSIIGKISKFFNRFYGAFITITLVLLVGFLVFMFTWPFNVAQLKSIDVKNNVQSGGIVEYTVDYCQSVGGGVERHTRRFLVPTDADKVNPIELSSNPSLETLQGSQGCKVSKPIKIPIDTSIPEGTYKIMIQVQYCIFPGRCISVEQTSKPFEVTKPDILGQLRNINAQLESINDYYGQQPKEVGSNGSDTKESLSNAAPVITSPGDPNDQPAQNISNTDNSTTNNTTVTNTPQTNQSGIIESTLELVNGLLNVRR